MERKPRSKAYVEPMPRGKFLALMKDFKASGGKYIANDESERFLDAQGAEAITLNATTILFRKRPTRSAVYEELFHVKQFRDGLIDGTIRNAYECEIEAQVYLLDNSEKLELTESEIMQTQKALDRYRELLNKMKGDDQNDDM